MEFKKKSDEFGKDFVHVGIFHSPTDNLNRTMKSMVSYHLKY